MDQDIASANELELDRIAIQGQRDEAQQLARIREARFEAETAEREAREERERRRLEAFEAQTANLLKFYEAMALNAAPEAGLTFRQRMAIAIAPKYFTTSTGRGPAAEADAIADAERFKFALDEACKAV